jgi:hypothetical protein
MKRPQTFRPQTAGQALIRPGSRAARHSVTLESGKRGKG